MRLYFAFIKQLQNMLIGVSVLFLMLFPMVYAFLPELFSQDAIVFLYVVSLFSVTFVMSIRPLADILFPLKKLRSLVILRKGFGILSASIIVGLLLSKIIATGGMYLLTPLTAEYWSFEKYALLAHLGDLSGLLLLITSNAFSKRILKKNWKRIQKLAYVYFYSGALYEYLAFHDMRALQVMVFVTVFVAIAWIVNKLRNK